MRNTVLSLFLSAGVALAVVLGTRPEVVPPSAAQQETVYDRVLKAGTLRCGYFEEVPFTIKDPNTGAMSGIAVELAESIAHDIGLKLEWAQSVNFSTLTEDLAQGRYDAICASVFNLSRAGRIDYTLPYAYVPVYGHARVGDSRFDSGFASVDWSKVTVAGLDGEGATNAALQALPQAQFAILPQGSQIAEMLLSVADSKADIAFVLPTVFGSFNANNPGKLVRVQSDRPLYTFAVSFGIKPGEFAFKNMLDISLRQRIASGQLGALFAKYDPSGFFFQPKLY